MNYCGVIIGNDLQYNPEIKQITINKKSYFDRGAKKRNKEQIKFSKALTDEELFDQITRTYRILMNRSIHGTYVYVCDKNLRDYLAKYINICND